MHVGSTYIADFDVLGIETEPTAIGGQSDHNEGEHDIVGTHRIVVLVSRPELENQANFYFFYKSELKTVRKNQGVNRPPHA